MRKPAPFYLLLALPWLLAAVPSFAQLTVGPTTIGTYVLNGGIVESTVTLSQELDQARAAGIGLIRITFDGWGYVETSSGVFNWTRLDRIVNMITGTYGMDLLFTMPISAPWNLPAGTVCPQTDPTFPDVVVGCTHFPTNNMGLVYRFANKVAERYRGKIKYYEAWNEPDASFFWKAQKPPDVTEYFAYMKNVYQGIKAADPTAKVMMGGLAFPEDYTWIGSLMALGGGNYMDALNFHFYGLATDLTTATNNLHKVESDFGLSKPIWITETSYTGKAFPTSDTTTEERKKSIFLAQYMPQLLNGTFEKVIWHSLRNPSGCDFALMDGSGNPLPAYTMMQKFLENFGGTAFAAQVSTGPLLGWRFRSATKDVYMFYSASGSHPILPALASYPNFGLVTDADGNETLKSSDGVLTFSVGKDPVFLSALQSGDSIPPVFSANLTGQVLSSTSAYISWNAATDDVSVAGYELDIAKNPNFVNCIPGYQGKKFLSSLSTEVDGLEPRTLYYVRVCAYDAVGNKTYSSPMSFMTSPAEPGVIKENILANRVFMAPLADGPEPIVFGPEARRVEIKSMRGRSIFTGVGDGTTPLIWTGRDSGGRVVESGAYLAAIKDENNGVHYQVIVVAK